MDFKDLIEKYDIKLELSRGVPDRYICDEWHRDANQYMATIIRGDESFTTTFFTGRGWTHDPDLVDILECLQSDAGSIEGCETFRDWMDGRYHDDRRSAYRSWRMIKRNTSHLKRLLGEHYEEFMKAERL